MAMTKSEVRQAFRTAMAADFAHVPAADDVEHRFSPAFGEKMAALIAKERRGSWQLLSPRRRRALVVAAILAAALLLTACSPTLRQAVVELILTFHERSVNYGVTGSSHEEIETVYVFDPVPEGFTFVSQAQHNSSFIETFYEDDAGNIIVLAQSSSASISGSVDNEKGTVLEITEEDVSVLVYLGEFMATAHWFHDDYYRRFSYYNPITYTPIGTDQILSLTASLAPMEQGGLSDGND